MARTSPQLGGLDRVNRPVWESKAVLLEFDLTTVLGGSWSDPGERAALLSVAPAVRGKPILDVGVGTGRTTAWLLLLSDKYVAVDYTPEMVRLCRRAYPHLDVRVADARDLQGVDDQHFGLVVFSFNGIDAVDHEGRQAALRSMHRVLDHDGMLLFSTHNKSGPCFLAPPWRPAGPIQRETWTPLYRLARATYGLLRDPGHFPRSLRNWFRLRGLSTDAGGWGVSPVEAHDYSLLIHFTTLDAQRRELEDAGFELLMAFDAEHGSRLDDDSDLSDVRYFHVVARKIG